MDSPDSFPRPRDLAHLTLGTPQPCLRYLLSPTCSHIRVIQGSSLPIQVLASRSPNMLLTYLVLHPVQIQASTGRPSQLPGPDRPQQNDCNLCPTLGVMGHKRHTSVVIRFRQGKTSLLSKCPALNKDAYCCHSGEGIANVPRPKAGMQTLQFLFSFFLFLFFLVLGVEPGALHH